MSQIEALDLTDVTAASGLVRGRRGPVLVVLFDRAEVGNAFDSTMKAALAELWDEVALDHSIRCVVLGSTTTPFFSTGRDVREVAENGTVSADVPLERGARLTARQAAVWTPVVAAVEGKVVGGGLHFVVDADIVVAGSSATFADTHVNVGFVGALENIGLARKAGLGAALYLTLLGKSARLDAGRALDLGLVQEVVPDGQALARAVELAEAVARNSPSAVSRSLEALWASLDMTHHEALRYGWQLVRRQWDHPDSTEGPRAFAEGREPRWTS